jgi:hypothetical protein
LLFHLIALSRTPGARPRSKSWVVGARTSGKR